MCTNCGFAGCGCTPPLGLLFGAAIDGVVAMLFGVLTLVSLGAAVLLPSLGALLPALFCAWLCWSSIKSLQTRR